MAELKDNDMEKHKKSFTWSKGIVLVTGILFIVVVLFTLYMYITGSISSVYDTASLGICISVSGAIFGSNLVWYSKKAASENHFKLRIALFSDSAKIRLQYNEEMMKLMKQYDMSEEDIEKINDSGDLDDMMNSSISKVIEGLDQDQDDCESRNELETFNI